MGEQAVPAYWKLGGTTFVLEADRAGNWAGHWLNWRTGRFDRRDDRITDVLLATAEPDIAALDADEFVWETESVRSELRGDGEVFALYDTIDAMLDQAGPAGLGPMETLLIQGLRARTFELWQIDARRAPGEPSRIRVTGFR
ncbi:hypothetical protein [Actinokineospora enzanensis]|uniref:hypothetical protein n=1 Tax=Actinokineospora enzanensis TaxID=155975 RepID=UPI000366E94E|nr:hypothetical protein [Actinokineospora enzanensis]